MFESWLTSSEDWKSSKLLLTLRSKTSKTKRGLRRWMTFQQMVAQWGEEIALEMKNHKEADEHLRKTEIRRHPDLPKRDDSRLQLVV